jgi:hypothetical protein
MLGVAVRAMAPAGAVCRGMGNDSTAVNQQVGVAAHTNLALT